MSLIPNAGFRRDITYNSLDVTNCLKAAIVPDVTTYSVFPPGCIVYDQTTTDLYVSSGTSWTTVAGLTGLPPSLNSIAGLTTIADQMLYTTGADTYATTPLSAVGRTLLADTTQLGQQTTLGLVVGTDVQAYSATLNGIAAVGPIGANNFLSTTGVDTFQVNPTGATGISLVGTATAAAARTILSAVSGPGTSTSGNIALWDSATGTLLQDSIVSVDGSGNITNANDITLTGQSQSVTLRVTSTSQMDGTLTMTSGATVTGLAAPSASTDAATKSYVDTAVAGLGNPLPSVVAATTAQLTVSGEAGAGIGKTITGTVGNLGTIDGITLVLNDDVLVRVGTSITTGSGTPNNSSSNGVYTVTDDGSTPGPNIVLTRHTDADTSAELADGRTVFVETGGFAFGGAGFQLVDSVTTVDTDPIRFSQSSAAQNLVEGDGITISGNVITAEVDGTSISFTGSAMRVDPTQSGLTLTSCTIDSATNTVRASSIATTGSPVVVSGATAPSGGEFLVATGATAANWQSLAEGNGIDISGTTISTEIDGTSISYSGTAMRVDPTQSGLTLTSCTIDSATNTVRASSIATTGSPVVVSASGAPSSGNILSATSATTAAWGANTQDIFVPVAASSDTGFGLRYREIVALNTSRIDLTGFYLPAGFSVVTLNVPLYPVSAVSISGTINWEVHEVFSGDIPTVLTWSGSVTAVSVFGATSTADNVEFLDIASSLTSPSPTVGRIISVRMYHSVGVPTAVRYVGLIPTMAAI